ncbi:metallo-beta-lactamase domain-containing protein 1-like isoform X1 [Biomphalaria glabrata]|uniref:Metallo-beta-lactamase domain-containing protein 1 n=1 Tax=Biomphalaria glabrata TaxID=6526 RepID=A0A9U8ECJ4_BIOGL|nr:metallo-beta-lactamase domain-containing protein 1-like isoform X1 [Biomphalaria glabrata]XP_013081218.2 metallo-beta-lactamase domain-containing protein 1-like isoform X1 [Biomphalaria glabrata]
MYDIIILKEGYTQLESQGTIRSCGSITLLKGPRYNIIVDTGNPWDRDLLLQGLNDQGLKPEDIHYVVCSHGHSDHVGNLNLFPAAVHCVGFDICRHDQYLLHEFKEGIPYEIDEDVEIWPTPGHTGSDVSVLVKKTNLGTVAVVGDLFECEADLDCPSLWQENSERPHLQEQSRITILGVADFIIPGHGPMFQVPEEYKSQMRVVMLMEEHFSSPQMTSSTSECKDVSSPQ